MQVKELDLSKFKKGATLDAIFEIPGGKTNPYLIYVTSEDGKIMYYQRLYDGDKVSINLPKIPESGKVLFLWSGNFPLKQILTGPLRITKIRYVFDEKIKQTRPYKFEDIKEEVLPYIPQTIPMSGGQSITIESDQPARFFPPLGVIQYSQKVLSKVPEPVFEFIKSHEKGHYYYGRPMASRNEAQSMSPDQKQEFMKQLEEDEVAADRFAMYDLVNRGYNFTGTLYALTNHLPEGYMSKQRIMKLYNEISNIHKHLK